MIFSPVIVVALSTLLVSPTLASPLVARQAASNSSSNVVDPHQAPDVPSNHTSPIAYGGVAWADAFSKAKALVEQMTVEEKSNITSGFSGPCAGNTGTVARLGIPSFCFTDGPVGPRPVDLVTQFPAGVTVSATWDHDLIYARAHAMGQEFKGKGVNTALAPVTGGPLGRSPLAGRGWEGFAPDVYLNGIASKLSVRGLQDSGVVACSKHFIAYEQETFRSPLFGVSTNLTKTYQQIDSVVDDKTMHEVYLPGFAEAVRAGTGSIMCSYNSVNGIHACENDAIQNTLLKGELGFEGYIMSDWGGTWSTKKSGAYGLDSSMPGGATGFFGEELTNLTLAGDFDEKRLDDMALRILTPHMHQKQDADDYPKVNFDSNTLADKGEYGTNEHVNVQADHWKIVLSIAEESATLLKNVVEGGRGLPLPSTDTKIRIGVFGDDAGAPQGGLTGCGNTNQCYDSPADSSFFSDYDDQKASTNGTVTTGGGSGANLPPYVISPLEALTARTRRTAMTVDYELSNDVAHYPYVDNVARIADKAIVFVSAFQFEGGDRADLQLGRNGSGLINEVASYCSDTIVVIHSGQTVDMESWIDHVNVTAVVLAYYPGQESGAAIESVLFGDISPSGKLPFTIGKALEDWPADSIVVDDVFTPTANFSEGPLIDYKWFDAKNITPRYPFGFGLSYSTFEYSDATVKEAFLADSDYVQLTNEVFDGDSTLYDVLYEVGVTVQNTGDVVAAEVAQVYVSYPSSITDQPIRSLRGFCKERYDVGESKTLTFPIRAKDLAVYDVNRATWTIPSGEYTISVGRDSRDLPLTVTLQI